MDSMFSGLFSPDEDEQQGRQHAEDFVRRVESGDPTEGFSDEEAVRSYSNVASRLSPSELEDAATQAMERFSPEQRREFANLLQQRAGDQVGQVNPEDPRQMAQLTTQLQSQSPDGLVGLLGGGSLDSILGGLLGGGSQQGGGGGGIMDAISGTLGGDDKGTSQSGAASQGSAGDLLNNPIAKAILAAIAAMAMKKFMGGGAGGGLGDLIGGGGGGAGDTDAGDAGDRAPRRRDGLKGGDTRQM